MRGVGRYGGRVGMIGLLGLMVLLAGCGSKEISGPIVVGTGIPFDLKVPFELSGADYYIIAGTKGEQQDSQVADSVVSVAIFRTYAEFYPEAGAPVDFDVFVNNTELQRHDEGDTLRLRGTGDTNLVNGDHVWRFRDQLGEEIALFVLPSVGLLDTIGPLQGLDERGGLVRGDTAFTLRWQPGKGGSIRIEWETEDAYIARDAQDFSGSYVIPAAVMASLQGEGKVRVTRYQTITSQFRDKTILAMRLSQRSYSVNVR